MSNTISKNITFNYFKPQLIVDPLMLKNIRVDKSKLDKLLEKLSSGLRLNKNEKEFITQAEYINNRFNKYEDYETIEWDMDNLLTFVLDGHMNGTDLMVNGVTVEIEPESIEKVDGLISFQVTQLREHLLPAKKKVGEVKEEIYLEDEEYLGEFVSILYDCVHRVLMIQSNNYGASTRQIARYLTLLRRKYIEATNVTALVWLEGDLQPIIDPKQVEILAQAEYFRKIRVKGSDYLLDNIIDQESPTLLGRARRTIGEARGVNFDITISVSENTKVATLDQEDVRALLSEYSNIEESEREKLLVEVSKKDSEEDKVELVNLLKPRLKDTVKITLEARETIEHSELVGYMKEKYQVTRERIAQILIPIEE